MYINFILYKDINPNPILTTIRLLVLQTELLTKVNTASALFWDSPYHLSTMEETLKLINLAPVLKTEKL